MGVATAVIAGLSLASAIGNYNQSKSEARQTAKQGAIAAQNRADEIKRLAAKQRVSYLQAGLELEGTPQAVINDTYNTGLADINEIKSAYNQSSKNIMTQARANLLGSIAKTGASALSGGVGGSDGGLFGSGIIEAGGGSSTATINGVYQGMNTWRVK